MNLVIGGTGPRRHQDSPTEQTTLETETTRREGPGKRPVRGAERNGSTGLVGAAGGDGLRLVYLVRHGESEWNAARRTQGQTAHPALTSLGRRQAARAATVIQADLAHRFAAPPDDVAVTVVTSDLVRAVQTAEIISQRLALPAAPRTDPRLREQALGGLEGKAYVETYEASEGLDWTDSNVQVGGGESARQVYARMAEALAGLPGERVNIVVSHGDAIRYALGWSRGCFPAECPWVAIANGGVVALGGCDHPPRVLVSPLGAAWPSAWGRRPPDDQETGSCGIDVGRDRGLNRTFMRQRLGDRARGGSG